MHLILFDFISFVTRIPFRDRSQLNNIFAFKRALPENNIDYLTDRSEYRFFFKSQLNHVFTEIKAVIFYRRKTQVFKDGSTYQSS